MQLCQNVAEDFKDTLEEDLHPVSYCRTFSNSSGDHPTVTSVTKHDLKGRYEITLAKKAIFWGWNFPLHLRRIHTAYIGEASSIFFVPEIFGELSALRVPVPLSSRFGHFLGLLCRARRRWSCFRDGVEMYGTSVVCFRWTVTIPCSLIRLAIETRQKKRVPRVCGCLLNVSGGLLPLALVILIPPPPLPPQVAISSSFYRRDRWARFDTTRVRWFLSLGFLND